jgi:hypothetical protein
VNDVLAKTTDKTVTNFKEEKTNREARGSTTSSFRGDLKVPSNRKVKERKTKKQRTSTSMDEIGDKSQISYES